MPALWNDPRLRQLLLFLRRYVSQPYFDVESVPAILAMESGTVVFWRRIQVAVAAILAVLVLSSTYTLKTDPTEFDGFGALCGVVACIVFLTGARFAVIRLRASFGQCDVTVKERGKTWTQPINSYLGVSWVFFTTVSYTRLFQIGGKSEYINLSNPTVTSHHWIEFVHPDPEKTLILAVMMKEGGMQERLESYSRFLKRPILGSRVEIKAA